MTTALKTITCYLSVRTNDEGKRVWTLVVHNEQRCVDADLADALALARSIFGVVAISVWDADIGAFDSEMLACPHY